MLSPLPRRSGWATFAHSTQPYQPKPAIVLAAVKATPVGGRRRADQPLTAFARAGLSFPVVGAGQRSGSGSVEHEKGTKRKGTTAVGPLSVLACKRTLKR